MAMPLVVGVAFRVTVRRSKLLTVEGDVAHQLRWASAEPSKAFTQTKDSSYARLYLAYTRGIGLTMGLQTFSLRGVV